MGHILHESQNFRLPDMGSPCPVKEGDTPALPEELLSVLLHDLRSPLGAIEVLVELLSSAAEQDVACLELHQLNLLREASTKANRMMDDAVEVQSIIRGSSTFTLSVIEADVLLRSCLEKAKSAPYFRNVQLDYDSQQINQHHIRVDMEKTEAAIFCIFEHLLYVGHATSLEIVHTLTPAFLRLHFTAGHATWDGNSADSFYHPPLLRCRLGNHRPGESRYSLQVTHQVMKLMGGQVDEFRDEHTIAIVLSLPLAITLVH